MNSLEPLQLEGHCYVLLQGNWIHPIAHRRHELLWYPERSMTLHERHMYRPFVKSIVTEDAWLIGMYDREKVRVIYDDDVDTERCGKWVMPNHQTYGASHNAITCSILGIQSTISAMCNDGGDNMREKIKKYKSLVDKANKLYKV
jgi:hypothetical protein